MEHSNTVTITAAEFTAVDYTKDSLIITAGQSSKQPADITHPFPDFEITIDCGRKASEEVARLWGDATGGAGHNFAPEGGDDATPATLNFYYSVEVTTKLGNKTTLFLGQGSYAMTNNWWVGGADIVVTDDVVFLKLGTGKMLELYTLSGTNESFRFLYVDL